ncbi:MAG: hypothetical protein ACO3RX_00660 [Chthoniobacterales bacterium]
MKATSRCSWRVSLNIVRKSCRTFRSEASGTWDLLASAMRRGDNHAAAMEHSAKWFLKKHEDGEVFGPVDFGKLKEWTRAAQVSPLDMVSDDKVNWVKAPMLQQLHMDYLIQLGDDSYYGPTTEEAVQEFLRLGEIHADTVLINCCTGVETVLRDSGFFQGQPPPMEDIAAGEPGRRTIRQNLQQRIRELELLFVERRRELEMADARIRQLERRLQDAGVRTD